MNECYVPVAPEFRKQNFKFGIRAKAKAGEEEPTESIHAARGQLGHASVGLKEQDIRTRKGMKVTPYEVTEGQELHKRFFDCGKKN
ncbi:hypothetical protein ICA15_07225 [Pseudomonas sp. P116]|nr:hypothetical protein [Pseudomonas sp. P9(2020)]MBZ9561939.1 hypothetical protein [Pseudomonas sp. P116]